MQNHWCVKLNWWIIGLGHRRSVALDCAAVLCSCGSFWDWCWRMQTGNPLSSTWPGRHKDDVKVHAAQVFIHDGNYGITHTHARIKVLLYCIVARAQIATFVHTFFFILFCVSDDLPRWWLRRCWQRHYSCSPSVWKSTTRQSCRLEQLPRFYLCSYRMGVLEQKQSCSFPSAGISRTCIQF